MVKESIVVEESMFRKPDRRITPYKLEMLMKAATKIIGTLTNIPNFMVSYDDMEFVLDVVASAIKRARDLNVQTERSEKE